MTVDLARIASKCNSSAAAALELRESASVLAQDTYADWDRFSILLAEAEGKAYAWLMLQMRVDYRQKSDAHYVIVEAEVLEVALDLMLSGADDSWSGRGNDAKRARFDGIRSACSDMRHL